MWGSRSLKQSEIKSIAEVLYGMFRAEFERKIDAAWNAVEKDSAAEERIEYAGTFRIRSTSPFRAAIARIEKAMSAALEKELAHKVSEQIASEPFIDGIIDRINKKQLRHK